MSFQVAQGSLLACGLPAEPYIASSRATARWEWYKDSLEIGAARYRTEKAQIFKSAKESAGKSARLLSEGTDWNSAWRTVSLGNAEARHCSQQSP